MKNKIVPIISTLLVAVSGFGVYKTVDSNQEINNLKKETQSLKTENTTLSSNNKTQKKENENISNKLKKAEKEIVSLKKEVKNTENGTAENVEVAEQSAATPNTDFKTSERQNQTVKQNSQPKEQSEELPKEEEPQYATYNDSYKSLSNFATENGVTLDDIYQLNPGAKAEPGKTFRIK